MNEGITFRSYEEERDWVEERRRKRESRPSKFDVMPTPEQQQLQQQALAQAAIQMASTGGAMGGSIAGAAVVMAPGSQQQTRHARRVYVGNLPPAITDDQIRQRFNEAFHTAIVNRDEVFAEIGDDAILSVYMNNQRRFCFLEFKMPEMATACMDLDGMDVMGVNVKIKRPNDYNPSAPLPSSPVKPIMDVSRLGIVSSNVPDGPNKVFIGGLHYHLQQHQVMELLQVFGKVKAFHLVMNDVDPGTGVPMSKGYCFVEYADPAVTAIAIQGLNGMDIGGGKSLTARLAGERTAAPLAMGMAPAMPNVSPALAAALGVTPAAATSGSVSSDRNIVAGFDIEELVDAAMGLKPMPAAPTHMDNFGMPLTRIVPVAVLPNAAVSAATPAVPAQGLHSAAATSGVPPMALPTRILVLKNMVTDEDLATEDDYHGLIEEVQDECKKFGSLESIRVPRSAEGGVEASAVKKIFLEYKTVMDAQAADRELNGRQFGDAKVETEFYSEADFMEGKLR